MDYVAPLGKDYGAIPCKVRLAPLIRRGADKVTESINIKLLEHYQLPVKRSRPLPVQHAVGKVSVAIDVLDVIELFERIDQADDLLGKFFVAQTVS